MPTLLGWTQDYLAMVVLITLEATGYQATASDAFYPGSWASLMTMDIAPSGAGTPVP
jgi:hypothetical protein